ncbi:MAG: low temperature requirement protein A [Chloroflexi bacterium]|nr:MAG: low temperature requirement protein A [Chloroflexota bacterium]
MRRVSSAPVNSAVPSSEPRVSSLELFFDLVFVFTITQLTSLLLRDPTLAGLLQMFLLFGNVWWMYGGYAWLTNAVPPRAVAVRLLLLLGMGGFLLIALAIPTAFGNGGIVFGIGYLVVTLVHTGLFMQSSRQHIISAVTRLGPFNLITAVLLLVAGFTPGGIRVLLFALGFVLHWITPFLIPQSSFTIRAGHFVERHGLILLIALGESVVTVGIGLGVIELPLGRIVAALLGLALTAALWWLYFSGDEARAEAALDTAAGSRKPWLALNAFGYAFIPILGGIVLVAAGLKLAVVRYNEPSTVSAAVFLAAGVAIYLAGLALFRGLIHARRMVGTLLMGFLAILTTFIGLRTTPVVQLAALVVILVVGNVAEIRAASNR